LPGGETCADVPALLRHLWARFYMRMKLQGELGFYIVSDNSIATLSPAYPPSELINLTALRDMVIGWKIAT